MNEVAKTIGTKVSYAWETESGVRPETGYNVWCDCTSHPDFNPEPEQIETTSLCEENNKTYTNGLFDYGVLSFGFNLTQDIYNSFLGADGILSTYKEKQEEGLGLWVAVDIKALNKSFFIKVEPQQFGLPEGEAGSNKYDLQIRFNPVGSGVWANKPIYEEDTSYKVTITITGTHKEGATVSLLGYQTKVADDTGIVEFIVKPGIYDVKVSNESATTQYAEADASEGNANVTISNF